MFQFEIMVASLSSYREIFGVHLNILMNMKDKFPRSLAYFAHSLISKEWIFALLKINFSSCKTSNILEIWLDNRNQSGSYRGNLQLATMHCKMNFVYALARVCLFALWSHFCFILFVFYCLYIHTTVVLNRLKLWNDWCYLRTQSTVMKFVTLKH